MMAINQHQKGRGRSKLSPHDKERMREKAEAAAQFHNLDVGDSSQYSRDEKLWCVVVWLITRSLPRVSEETGIKLHTIKYWKYHAGWWPDAEKAILAIKNEELDRRLTDVIDASVEGILSRLEEGDEVVLKDGSKVRKDVNAKDLTYILSVLYDKRALMRGEVTQRTETKKDTQEHLEKLTNIFEDIAYNRTDNEQKEQKEIEHAESSHIESWPLQREGQVEEEAGNG